MMRSSPRLTLVLLLVLFAGGAARGDEILLKDGRRFAGGIQREDPSSVSFNPYFSRNPGMVFGVETFPRSKVKELVRKDPPFVTYMKKALAIAPGDAAGHVALAHFEKEAKRKDLAEHQLLLALEADPKNEAALREFGRSKFSRFARGNPEFDPDARSAIDAYLKIADPKERKKAYDRLKRDHGIDLPRVYLDRVLRSMKQPTGLIRNRPLTLGAAGSPGVYTLFVPKNYDPRRTWPLVIGLHGGGPGGKDRDAVVGNGASAMNFYIEEATARGYIVACPNALAAPWAAPVNKPLLRSVITEVELLYNVDRNRVYLTGHSMGGFGCWYWGTKWADEFAAISPMAGGGSGVARLVKTRTPIFLYHGADDPVVSPASDRAAARQLAKTKLDFIYTELTGVGHGFPPSIRKGLFDFFDTRRLAPMHGHRPGPPTDEVSSSFLAKVSRDEVRYLGDPRQYSPAGTAEDWKALVKDLALGGGRAEKAAARLGKLKAKDSVKPICDLLKSRTMKDDVKVYAARALGAIGSGDAYSGLRVALHVGSPEVIAAAARAMARIDSPKAPAALLSALPFLVMKLDAERVRGDRIYYSDWERWLDALTAVVRGIGEKKAEGGTAAIRDAVVKGVLSAGFSVEYSARAGQDPNVPKRKLALAAVAAVSALGEPEKDGVLAAIGKACAKDAAVTRACRGAAGGG